MKTIFISFFIISKFYNQFICILKIRQHNRSVGWCDLSDKCDDVKSVEILYTPHQDWDIFAGLSMLHMTAPPSYYPCLSIRFAK